MKGDFFLLRVKAVIWEGKFYSVGACGSLGTRSSNDNFFTQSKNQAHVVSFELILKVIKLSSLLKNYSLCTSLG